MRIGLDARLYNESGIGRYTRNLITYLKKLDKLNEYYIFHLKSEYDRLVYHKNFKKIQVDFGWYGVAEQTKFPRLLNKYNLNLVHFPHFNVPIFYKGKLIVTVHDLIHQHFEMKRATTLNPLIYKIKKIGYKKVFKNAINNSQKIITVSSFVKKQLVKEWSINDNKIIVTPEAVEVQLIAIATHCTQDEMNQILSKFNIRGPFLFYVGNAHPHKNVEGLIKVFLEIKKKNNSLQLVLSGNDHYFWQRIKKEVDSRLRGNDRRAKDIIFTGFVNDEELVALYKSAKAFVMPSLEEGFGIPLLEAFACSCPVVSSDAGSLSEVGGDGAIYFDPNDKGDMINKIMEVVSNEKLRKELINKGEKRYKQFSWEKLAKQTLDVYNTAYEK